MIDGRRIAGQRTDTEGKFWQFDAQDLEPDRDYTLALIDASERPITNHVGYVPPVPFKAKLCQPRTFSPGKRVFKPARTLYLAMTGL